MGGWGGALRRAIQGVTGRGARLPISSTTNKRAGKSSDRPSDLQRHRRMPDAAHGRRVGFSTRRYRR
jgi:hypothetical protein